MSTEELVEKCIGRDKLAWDEFVQEYEGLVKRAVYYKLNRMNSNSLKNEADDIVQEVFLMLWEENKLAKLKDLSGLKGWLVIVSINKTLNYCKRRWKERRVTKSLNETMVHDEPYSLEDVIPSKAFDPSKALEVKEMAEGIQHSMNMLKGKERRALELNLYAGKRQSDIAGMMGMPENTVATIIRRAKGKVREGMKAYCIS